MINFIIWQTPTLITSTCHPHHHISNPRPGQRKPYNPVSWSHEAQIGATYQYYCMVLGPFTLIPPVSNFTYFTLIIIFRIFITSSSIFILTDNSDYSSTSNWKHFHLLFLLYLPNSCLSAYHSTFPLTPRVKPSLS